MNGFLLVVLVNRSDRRSLSIPLNGFPALLRLERAGRATPFNSIEWILLKIWFEVLARARPFNSIEWIQLSRLAGVEPVTRRLSIPLNGFGATSSAGMGAPEL